MFAFVTVCVSLSFSSFTGGSGIASEALNGMSALQQGALASATFRTVTTVIGITHNSAIAAILAIIAIEVVVVFPMSGHICKIDKGLFSLNGNYAAYNQTILEFYDKIQVKKIMCRIKDSNLC